MPKSVIIVFLDGVGLGDTNPEANPFMHVDMVTVQSLLGVDYLTRDRAGTISDRAALLGLDATLEVGGMPQSATGQTAILTGRNAAAALGEHYGPYPNEPLREMLAQDNVFKTVLAAGRSVAYANAYPTRFLDRLARGKGRLSANTQAAVMSGVKLRTGQDLRAGRALSALMSNEFWPEPEIALPPLSAFQAGQQLVSLAGAHTLTFFEFWYSDLLGHKQQRSEALEILAMLNDFLAGILADLDRTNTLLLVVSDHGNFEDWTTNKHTTNPALTILSGAGFQAIAPRLQSLVDIKGALTSFLEIGN